MIILKTSCILGGKPLKILIVWHLKPRYGISAKTGPQLKARLDEINVMRLRLRSRRVKKNHCCTFLSCDSAKNGFAEMSRT